MPTSPAPLSPVEAHRVLHELLSDRDSLSLSRHLREQSHGRTFDIFDLRHALQCGAIRVDSWDVTHQNWKYRVCGVDVEGEPLTVIVVLLQSLGVIKVVTAF